MIDIDAAMVMLSFFFVNVCGLPLPRFFVQLVYYLFYYIFPAAVMV